MEQQPATQAEAAGQFRAWPDIFEVLALRLRDEHGLNEEAILNTQEDLAEGMPIIILDAEQDFEVVYLSTSFEVTTGWQGDAILGKQGIDFLRLRPDAVHDTLNREAWQAVIDLQRSVTQHVAGTPCPDPATVLLVSAHATGAASWSVLDVVPIALKLDRQCRYLALVVIPMDAPVPPVVCEEGAMDVTVATAFVETARGDLVAARHDLAQSASEEIAQRIQEGEDPEGLQEALAGTLVMAADVVRKEIMHIHEDAQEGDNYVPKLGWKWVEAFSDQPDSVGQMADKVRQFRAAWQISTGGTASFAPQQFAYCIADPNGVDCPLVFVSAGFKELTGYDHCWALGRNCRFMQPNSRTTNMRINGPELQRIKQFCRLKSKGQMLSLLLNERADGRHFWNLMYIQQAYPEGSEAGEQHGWYIFAGLTSISLQKDALDMLVLQELGGIGSGERALQMLRDALREREEHFTLSEVSLLELIGETTTAWVNHTGQSITSFWEQGHFVPRVGTTAALNFSGMWPAIVDNYTSYLEDLLGPPAEGVNFWRANRDASLVCTVLDPLGMDCPVAFVSRGFQEMTGYSSGFCLGRNCRFLQPSTSGMNKMLNGEEIVRMQEFCVLRGKQAARSEALVALLLSRRRSGEHFWCLCHLTHVMVGTAPYILALYEALSDAAMPCLLKDIAASEEALQHDIAGVTSCCQRLGALLTSLRQALQVRWTQLAAAAAAAAAAAEEVIVISSAEPAVPSSVAMKLLAAQATEALEDFNTEAEAAPMASL